MFNSQNAQVLTAIKEIFTIKCREYNFNNTNAFINLQTYCNQISLENPVFYESNIDEIFNGDRIYVTYSLKVKSVLNNDLLMNGTLTRGIRQYDFLLSQLAQNC
ncbi:unnamed protein product (macronuclear) [Paramecium tetraurelia]|uniref:Uncharacterized protein n=1 Tax=Paramecium tetraurelia TaxID=5888 RepID=A0E0R6_PARTE|nr:uncharacterized protein GSPATT00022051001 [Paramecium tetraurelia]CAK88883.1 unnamed protein product [Paramecium tetraurelia]|eukprot:XP_001456280.1 hypothetical protein (macronuclear) [Paramecium tetraurelia strain d4-2]